MYATVVTESRQAGIGEGLTYSAPQASQNMLGSLVNVPLRKKIVEGIVVGITERKPEGGFEVKEVKEVLSETPLLSEPQIALAKWIADYYCCTLRQALTVFLPGMPWSKLLPKEESRHAERSRSTVAGPTRHDTIKLTPRQTAAYKVIKTDPRPTLLFGVTGSGKTEIYAALIRDALQEGKSAILLLPEIFLTENFIERFEKLVAREVFAVIHSRLTLKKRREAWQRCRSEEVRFVIGSRSALFYPLSNLGLVIIDEEHEWTYKNEQTPRYHAVKVAEVLSNLSVMSDFQYVNILKVRAASVEKGAPKLVLGSATPSVDSWYKAKTGQYQLVELPERYLQAPLPQVRIVDLGEMRFGKHYPLSPTLLEAIRKRLEKKEQCILFLNRRGFATSLLCLDCRYRFEDPETRLPYTVHHHVRHVERSPATCFDKLSMTSRGVVETPHSYLLSHHTGERLPIPEKCPKCNSAHLREVGAGTERVETLLKEFFPSARILRADTDTLKSQEEMRSVLTKMKEGKADILLGTQMVVKGLDLPNVTLAAVLLADIGLSLPHFRAGERIFQLLTQLAGRAGRVPFDSLRRVSHDSTHSPLRSSSFGGQAGYSSPPSKSEVIIQTFRPEALEIALAAKHDTKAYLEQELELRTKAHYPPDTQLVRFVFSGSRAQEHSQQFCDHIRELQARAGIERSSNFQYVNILKVGNELSVSRSPSLFSGGKVWQVLVRGKNVREMLKNMPKFDGTIDVDPVECL